MKFIVFLTGFFLLAFTINLNAQKREITLILLRHAEKDISPGASKSDPELSPEGIQRAGQLVETIKKYKPTQIYSTNFKRTRATVAPLADSLHPKYRLQVQSYDYNELEELVDRLFKTQSGTIVVVGHNTTTPMLANLLVKSEKYESLQDNEYDKVWIIKIKGKKIKDEVIKY